MHGPNRIPAYCRAALIAAALVAHGCDVKQGSSEPPPSESSYDPGSPSGAYSPPPLSEAERTREMEAKQAEMNRKLEAARSGGMSPGEIEQAYQDFERERMEMNQMAESAAPPPADAPAADYPPPPL